MKAPAVKFLLCSVAMLMMISVAASAQVNGALQTTTQSGTVVNYNVKPPLTCDAVYITGGPQNQKDAGLSPTGTYYFQVTNPSGSTLLSTDDVSCREVTVANVNGKGVITGSLAGGACLTGAHAIGATDPLSGETTVQLWQFNQTPNNGGVYKAWISTDPTFTNSTTKTDNFKCTPPITSCAPTDLACICAADPTNPLCTSPPPPSATITGYKFYDANTNGTFDAGEVGIRDWLIQVAPPAEADVNTDPLGVSCGFTSASPVGQYQFTVDPLSSHDINEGNALTPTSWLHTNNPGPITVVAGAGGTDTAGPNFGNVCTGAGGGLTLGFWSNKNGQALETAGDFTNLNALNLRDGAGNNKDFTGSLSQNKTALNIWLLSANAVNMAYMLSAQLTAMELNTYHGKVLTSALVYVGTPPAGCSLAPNAAGFVSIASLMSDANTLLGADGYTVAAGQDRTCQEFDKTALDKANNNLTFVQADQSSCPAFSFDSTILNACTF